MIDKLKTIELLPIMKKYCESPDITKLTMYESIVDIVSNLKWSLVDCINKNSTFEIFSDPIEKGDPPKKSHLILWPPDFYKYDAESFCLNYLHEIIHAQLCEQVHLHFSTSYFTSDCRELVDQMAPLFGQQLFQRAQDWFVDAKLYNLHPEPSIKNASIVLDRNLREKRQIAPEKWDKMFLLTSGWVYAQSDYFKIQRLEERNKTINKVICAFDSIDPNKPTVDNLHKLINLLFIALDSKLRVERVADEWKLVLG